MMSNSWILIPVSSALIGWLTIWVAFKMLFYPRNQYKVLGITVQGIFPRLAEKIGPLLSRELFSFKEISAKIADPANVRQIMPLVDEHVDQFLRVKLPQQMPVIGMFIGEKTISELKQVFTAELEALFPVVTENYIAKLENQFDLGQLIAHKISGLSAGKMEHIFRTGLRRQIRLLGLFGAGLGFMAGLLELLLLRG